MSSIRLPFNPDLPALCHCLALLPFNTSYLGTCFLRPRISHFSDVSFKLPKTGMHCIFPTYQIFLRTTLLLKAWTWYPSSLEMDICLCKYNNSVQLHTKWLITASYFVFLFFLISQVFLPLESDLESDLQNLGENTTLLQLRNKPT